MDPNWKYFFNWKYLVAGGLLALFVVGSSVYASSSSTMTPSKIVLGSLFLLLWVGFYFALYLGFPPSEKPKQGECPPTDPTRETWDV